MKVKNQQRWIAINGSLCPCLRLAQESTRKQDINRLNQQMNRFMNNSNTHEKREHNYQTGEVKQVTC